MGYMLDFEMQQNLTHKVDVDGSGKLDRREFRKMIRMMHEQDIEIFRAAFSDTLSLVKAELLATQNIHKLSGWKGQPRSGRNAFSESDLNSDHQNAFFSPTTCIKEEDLKQEHLTLAQAVGGLRRVFTGDLPVSSVPRQWNNSELEAFRDNGGFSQDQIAALRTSFDKYDRDLSGE